MFFPSVLYLILMHQQQSTFIDWQCTASPGAASFVLKQKDFWAVKLKLQLLFVQQTQSVLKAETLFIWKTEIIWTSVNFILLFLKKEKWKKRVRFTFLSCSNIFFPDTGFLSCGKRPAVCWVSKVENSIAIMKYFACSQENIAAKLARHSHHLLRYFVDCIIYSFPCNFSTFSRSHRHCTSL